MGKPLRVAITLILVALAVLAGTWIWNYYLYSPWTRDGRIRADVITIAPDVSGWVTNLNVVDSQKIQKGDPVFSIDRTRYNAAIEQAEAQVAQNRSAWELAQHRYERRKNLNGRRAISEEDLDTYRIKTESAKANVRFAQAKLKAARVDLKRTQVMAPADGTVINLSLREGNYVNRGVAVLSLVKTGSFYVTGYFEETKLQEVHVGQKARIKLMSGGPGLTGEVESIAAGIADTNSSSNNQLLPQVQQAFNWVRLAQRIPVDIALDPIPGDVRLSAGMTASIYLEADEHDQDESE